MAAFIPLERLLAEGRPGQTPVAVRGTQGLTWTDFAGQVGALADALGAGAGRWAVVASDAYAFAVVVTAIWQADGVAVVVPNGQPGTLAAIAPMVNGLVGDGVSVPGLRTIAPLSAGGTRAWTPRLLDRTAQRLELSTSGTTGTPRGVAKTLAQLGDEVLGLERRWGAELDGRLVLATVSHQHIYGLLFRVLWPLCAGRVFRAEPLLYPDEMRAALAGRAGGCLVTTPAHLRRLKALQGAGGLADLCRPIFSSGAPLDAASAVRLRETVGVAPFEVFGSTETGGVAWRQQDGGAAAEAWQPFDSVRVSTDAAGLLQVVSPYVGDPGGVTMSDRAALLPDGRFLLAGRTDRVVKIGGKRLALPEMEARLLQHPDVAEAALTAVETRGDSRVAAAVVLSPAGLARLAGIGRRALGGDLAAHLAPYWDRVLVPRLWRFVERLPEDAQGKVATAALARLFDVERGEGGVAPELLAASTTGTTCRRRWRVPDGLAWCQGHFPEMAVVPGFVQIGWIMDVARSLAGERVSLVGLDAVKFRELLRPGDVVELHADWSPAAGQLSYRLARDDGRIVASGRCRLVEGGA